MNYQDFLTSIRTRLSLHLGKDVTLHIQQIAKNNGIRYDGLIIIRPGINISPTIYLLPYYHRYLEGVSLEDICEDIVKAYRNNVPEGNFDTSLFTDFSKAKGRIVMRLVNYKKNEELLKNIPFFRFLDLAVVFYCLLFADEKQQASILIYNHHLDYWDVDAHTLYTYALENTPRLFPHHLEDISTVMPKPALCPCDESVSAESPMYVLTNTYRTNGATVILYDQLLRQLADSLGSDLVILPSSIHEVLLIPADSDVNLAPFHSIVREVNETQLADDEVLSEHAYFFSRSKGILSTENIAQAS